MSTCEYSKDESKKCQFCKSELIHRARTGDLTPGILGISEEDQLFKFYELVNGSSQLQERKGIIVYIPCSIKLAVGKDLTVHSEAYSEYAKAPYTDSTR